MVVMSFLIGVNDDCSASSEVGRIQMSAYLLTIGGMKEKKNAQTLGQIDLNLDRHLVEACS